MAEPKRRKQTSLILNPEQLAQYARLDRELPALIVKARDNELKRQFAYAVLSLVCGILALLTVVGGFIFLVLRGHAQAAAALLATGVLGLIGGFLRSRL